MRVLTPYGFANADVYNLSEVTLVSPFLGNKTMHLDPISEVFHFSDWAVIRVLNIAGCGLFSNIQFYSTEERAKQMLTNPSPPDETTFFLDLATGEVKYNRELGVLVRDTLLIEPWLDRWGCEKTPNPQTRNSAIRQFDRRRSEFAGASGGIWVSTLLDIQSKRILRFMLAVAPSQGVIFEKSFA